MRFKLNIPVRFRNPWFWVSLVGVILTAMGISPEMLTSWDAVGQAFKDLISNPLCWPLLQFLSWVSLWIQQQRVLVILIVP